MRALVYSTESRTSSIRVVAPFNLQLHRVQRSGRGRSSESGIFAGRMMMWGLLCVSAVYVSYICYTLLMDINHPWMKRLPMEKVITHGTSTIHLIGQIPPTVPMDKVVVATVVTPIQYQCDTMRDHTRLISLKLHLRLRRFIQPLIYL